MTNTDVVNAVALTLLVCVDPLAWFLPQATHAVDCVLRAMLRMRCYRGGDTAACNMRATELANTAGTADSERVF